ncbi:uncharacterized protein LOC131618718 [Vicia villosa]|uniref:uncharacterized protein LOC131618718 n=1 Tax=Vicia villosa TaxID=3911 RepID=UPI00273C40B8|nr:uncharacterized protein LOC131618718 [Vicia villosa]
MGENSSMISGGRNARKMKFDETWDMLKNEYRIKRVLEERRIQKEWKRSWEMLNIGSEVNVTSGSGPRRSARLWSQITGKEVVVERLTDGKHDNSLASGDVANRRSSPVTIAKEKRSRRVESIDTKEEDGYKYYSWCKVIDSVKVASENVLQFPQEVVRNCLDKRYTRVLFRDSDFKRVFKCELHYSKREYGVERYLWKGWCDFVKEGGIQDGDRLRFVICDKPCSSVQPGTQMVAVAVVNRSRCG